MEIPKEILEKVKPTSTKVASSNGNQVVMRKGDGSIKGYDTETPEEYIAPYFFNPLKRRQEICKSRQIIAQKLFQCLSFMNLHTDKPYKSISNFKPCNV